MKSLLCILLTIIAWYRCENRLISGLQQLGTRCLRLSINISAPVCCVCVCVCVCVRVRVCNKVTEWWAHSLWKFTQRKAMQLIWHTLKSLFIKFYTGMSSPLEAITPIRVTWGKITTRLNHAMTSNIKKWIIDAVWFFFFFNTPVHLPNVRLVNSSEIII